MNINYISHGPYKSGGFQHESRLMSACVSYLSQNATPSYKIFRKEQLFETWIDYLYLLIWAFRKSKADITITTARTALPAIWRNRFNKNEVWIVLHNYDEHDGKSWLMKTYYKVLFRFLSKNKDPRFKLIAVAPYWVNYFKTKQGIENTFLFPNFYDLEDYNGIATNKKNRWIHLGQYSSKNDPGIYDLAKRLKKDGYYCYFSTLDELSSRKSTKDYEVIKFTSFRDYLEQMARCQCTLALSKINEGWNRVAHESLLVGTPVLGFNRGGLGDLLKESNSIIVNSIDEAYTCIKEELWISQDTEFIKRYDIRDAAKYIQVLCQR